jgi:hypothetical protein
MIADSVPIPMFPSYVALTVRIAGPSISDSRRHIAFCDARARCHYTQQVNGLGEVIRIAEGVVRGHNQ